jgi:hypothetical protein
LRGAFERAFGGEGETYGQEGHADGDPAALAGAEDEGFGDAEGGHDLEVHDGRVPVGEGFGLGACGAVAEELDGEEVNS